MAVCTRHRNQTAMTSASTTSPSMRKPQRHGKRSAAVHALRMAVPWAMVLLTACASKPPPPDWQANAFAALNSYSSAYLEGNTRVADFEFARAQTEVARTGRLDLMARLELVRCAAQVASLVLAPCTGYLALAADAKPQEQAYAAFISGHWVGLDPKLLPGAYQGLVTSQAAASAGANSQLSQIQDPLSRLIAAGALLQKEQLSQTDIGLAIDTASDQGWRRPLLAWLGVQLKRSQAKGDAPQAASLQRRIDLILPTPASR